MVSPLVGTAIVVALLGSVVAAEPAVAESRCATAGKTVRANKVARVFMIRQPGARVYYGCSRDGGRVHRLIRVRSELEYLELPRLTGRYFAAEFWDISFHESVIFVWGVRGGREIWSGVTAEDEFAIDLEVTRRGAVAWATGHVIRKCDRKGLADIGSGASKLTRRGRTVYWSTGGRTGGVVYAHVLRGRARCR